MIRHVCKGCDTVLWSSNRLAGLPIKCEICRHENEVPHQSSDELPPRQRRRSAPRRASGAVVPLLIVVLAVMGVAGAFGVFAVAALATGRGPVAEPLTQTYTSKDRRTQIQVPRSWTEQPMEFSEEGELKVASWGGDACVKLLTEDKVILGQPMTRDEYGRVVIEGLKRNLDGPPTVTGPAAIKVNGRPALRYEVSGQVDGTPALFLMTIVEGESHFHQVVALTTSKNAESNRELLERITATFREVH
jgi:hypothetical protein